MNWISLTKPEQIHAILKESEEKPVLIFKHSTACSISSTAKGRLERQWPEAELPEVSAYYLDLLSNRGISNQIAEVFEVPHQSPQLLLIQDGECLFHASHMGINLTDIKRKLAA
jgi:bacillithiol system protein YtxJ